MRPRPLFFLLFAAALPACDIFHSTDFPTKCADGGCDERPAPPPPDSGVLPFTTDTAAALEHAKETCAWLGACESPMGSNAAGACLQAAILAFDQRANPSRPPAGASRAFWICAYAASVARSCDAMRACVYPNLEQCGGSFVGCSAASPATRIACDKAGSIPTGAAETCDLWGSRCAAAVGNTNAVCAGPQGLSCAKSGCSGTGLSLCAPDGGADNGMDCANVGARACVDTADAGGCVPAGAGSCAPTRDVTCDDAGVAHGCAAGVPETLDCTAFAGACTPSTLPQWAPPIAACYFPGPGCTEDDCSAGFTACLAGRRVPIDCASYGLTACVSVATPDGTRPACGKP